MVTGVLTTSYPRWPGDFAGSFVEDDVRALVAAGHQVDVIAAAGLEPRAPVADAGPIRVTRIPAVVAPGAVPLFYGSGAPEVLERGGPAAWVQAAAFAARLADEVARRAPGWDALVSHWLVPCAAVGAAVTRGRCPHRAFAHSGDVAFLEALPLGQALARWLAAQSIELVFVTEDLRARFAGLVGRAVGTVERLRPPAGFATATAEDRALARARLGLPGDRLVIVAAGRLVPIKGFDRLLVAAALARDPRLLRPALELVILGDGPERVRLQALATRRGLALRLPGFVPREEVATWLAAADVYAQPSRPLPSGRTEGLPLGVLEARAVGLPVVASRTGGLPELAAGDPGVVLVPPGDTAALAAALRTTLQARSPVTTA